MAILLYILALVFLLIVLVLISPVRLIIDTHSHTYSVQWKGIIQAKLITVNDEPTIALRTLVYKKNFELLHSSKKEKPKKEAKSPKWKKSKKSNKMTFSKIMRMINTFKIKAFYVNLDTDNYITNGYLYPIFHFIKSQNITMKINYEGQNNVKLIVENRLYRIIKAYLF